MKLLQEGWGIKWHLHSGEMAVVIKAALGFQGDAFELSNCLYWELTLRCLAAQQDAITAI